MQRMFSILSAYLMESPYSGYFLFDPKMHLDRTHSFRPVSDLLAISQFCKDETYEYGLFAVTSFLASLSFRSW